MLFGRHVTLQLGLPGDDGKAFTGFRVAFDVRMSRASTPNTATIDAYNLNPQTIALAQRPGVEARLLVGYDAPRLIFVGNPVTNGVRVSRHGVDRVLHIEAQDGGRAYQSARVSVAFSTATSLRQVYDAVAAQLGLPAGTIRVADGFTFPQGITLSGYARDVLDRIAASTGSEWFIRDGALQLVGAGEDTGEDAIVFSATAGNLIGSPTVKDDGVEVRALLAPSMRPGKVFKLESADHNGFYVAGDVAFVGDSGWDGAFYVVTTGTPRT